MDHLPDIAKSTMTGWDTKTDARPSNYGARIDYILVTEGLLPWIKGGDIQADIMGSDHCPVYVDLHEEITQADGSTLKLRDLMNAGQRVPLPASLQSLKDDSRQAPEPPAFATKFWDEFSGKQRSLKDFFGKPKAARPSQTPPPFKEPDVRHDTKSIDSAHEPSRTDTSHATASSASGVADAFAALAKAGPTEPDRTSKPAKPVRQPKVSAFFQPPRAATPPAVSDNDSDIEALASPPRTDRDEMIARALAESEAQEIGSSNNAEAVNTWSSIFAKKVPPKCVVHGQPCKLFSELQWNRTAPGS